MKVVVIARSALLGLEAEADEQGLDGERMVPIARLTQAGFRVVVASNQQALTQGPQQIEQLHDLNQQLLHAAAEVSSHIDGVFYTSTGDPDAHGKRQPKAALLEQVSERYRIPGNELMVIGTARSDLEAALSVGATAILLGSSDQLAELPKKFAQVVAQPDLASAAELIAAADQS